MAFAIAGSGFYLGTETIDEMVENGARVRTASFASYLLDDDSRIDALVTELARVPDLEQDVRDIAMLSGIESFSIFTSAGEESFATHRPDHPWLLRNRAGGMVTQNRIAEDALERTGEWQVVSDTGSSHPSVVMPLLRDDAPTAYLAAAVDLSTEKRAFAHTLALSSAKFVGVLMLITGVPAFLYIRRRRRMGEADERIVFLHNHDPLTKLLNRKRMGEETDRILSTARATRERMALWFLDLERLADINDTHGQAFGDEVLRVTAERLGAVVDRNDLISRTGADDFVILQRNLRSEEMLKTLAREILASTSQPIEYSGQMIKPVLALGVATTPAHGRTYADLVKHAELAFLHQRSVGRGDFTVFQPQMDEESHRRRQIEQMLRNALEQGGFELFYQPIVSGETENLLGFEALLRLPDARGGYVPPAVFIPIAEARGYIKAIGTWVINQAARQAALWPDHLFVSVNLSAVQFNDGDLVFIVEEALRAAGIEGRRLGMEVVETLLLERSDHVLDQLWALRRLGVSIDMDDFGTGYSSLGYLWRFPFDKLKIDQSFMMAFTEGRSSVSQIVQTIISLAHHLGLKVTAEGVETGEQAKLLRSFGCDQMQGFHFGKPKPAEEASGDILKSATDALPTRIGPSDDEGCNETLEFRLAAQATR